LMARIDGVPRGQAACDDAVRFTFHPHKAPPCDLQAALSL
jgi:hypothetical protein